MSACPLGQCDGSGVVVASFVSAAECVANLQVACACVAERVRELEKLQCEQGISGCDCNRPIESASPITVDEEQEVQWVVNDIAELGVRVGGRFYWLYKYDSPLIYREGHDDETPMLWRPIYKREFGEVVHPHKFYKPGARLPDKYTEGHGWQQVPRARQREGG